MRYIIILLSFWIATASAQTEILGSINRNNARFLPTCVAESESSIYIFSSKYSAFSFANEITIEKLSKTQPALIQAAKTFTSPPQADSTVDQQTIRAFVDSGKIHLFYKMMVLNDSTKPGFNKYWFAYYYQQLDTALNLLIPEKRLFISHYENGLGGSLIENIVKSGNVLAAIYDLEDTVSFNFFFSKAITFTTNGTVIANDTVPRKTGVLLNRHQAYQVAVMNNGNFLFSGRGLLDSFYSPSFVEANAALQPVDSFYFKLGAYTFPNGQTLGRFSNSVTEVVPLPSGNIIAAAGLAVVTGTAPLYTEYTSPVMMRFNKSTHYNIDTAILPPGTILDSTNIASISAISSCAYNSFEHRIYYSDITNTPDYYFEPCNTSPNYIQIFSSDTSLHNSWRKYIQSAPGYCMNIGTVTTCVGRPGALIAGFYYLTSNPDTLSSGGFLYRIDSSTNVGINDPDATVVIRDRLIVYPNPAKEKLYVDDILNHLSEVDIYNAEGKVMSSLKSNGSNVSISVVTYSPGLYLLRAKTLDGTVLLHRFVKE